MSDSVGCGAAGGDSRPGVLAQHSDHAAQLLERLAGGRAQQLGGLPDLLGRQVGPDLQRARVQRDQGDPVGEHVVHLAGDPGALGHARTVGVQTLLGLGAQRTLAQREEELTSGPDEHAPGDGGEHERDGHAGSPTGRRSWGCRSAKTRADGIHSAATSSTGRTGAVHGEGGQREQPGDGGGDRERPEQDTDQRNAERPASPPPQRETGQRPARDVDDHLLGRQRHGAVVQRRAQEERPERRRR